MKIAIIGTGYVGLVTAACFSELGHEVTCLDINKKKINQLKKGKIPFYEPNLEEFVINNVQKERLKFTSSYRQICKENNIFFICVDTPNDIKGNPNLTNLHRVIDSLSENIESDSIVITKSTVPLGTNKIIQMKFNRSLKNKNIFVDVCSNPEFLKEGSAVQDFMTPDRIIVGTESENAKELMKLMYERLNRQTNRLIFMDVASAELTKYASNAFLATKISFVNELSQLSEKIGADMHQVRIGMGSDPRIGKQFLYAGLGYGGSCFPKDVDALISSQQKYKLKSGILKSTVKVNNDQLEFFMNKILARLDANIKKRKLMIWGLSFKPETDDIRESVAIKLIKKLSRKVKNIYVYDPIASMNAKLELNNFKNVVFLKDKYKNIQDSDALIICTEWREFHSPELEELYKLKEGIIFDGRNFLSETVVKDPRLEYVGIGIK